MQKSSFLSVTRVVLLSAATSVVLASQPALADSVCKGLTQTDCDSQAQCRWQAGYTRKDGISVNSHCRVGTKKTAAPVSNAVIPQPETAPAPVVDKPLIDKPIMNEPVVDQRPPIQTAPALATPTSISAPLPAPQPMKSNAPMDNEDD